MAEITVEASEIPAQLPKVRVAVLGAGKMGGILLQAFLKENLFSPDRIHGTVQHAERALALLPHGLPEQSRRPSLPVLDRARAVCVASLPG